MIKIEEEGEELKNLESTENEAWDKGMHYDDNSNKDTLSNDRPGDLWLCFLIFLELDLWKISFLIVYLMSFCMTI